MVQTITITSLSDTTTHAFMIDLYITLCNPQKLMHSSTHASISSTLALLVIQSHHDSLHHDSPMASAIHVASL